MTIRAERCSNEWVYSASPAVTTLTETELTCSQCRDGFWKKKKREAEMSASIFALKR